MKNDALFALVREHTLGDVPPDVHAASRVRLLEAYRPSHGSWSLPLLVGAALVVMVAVGVNWARGGHASIAKDVAVAGPPLSAPAGPRDLAKEIEPYRHQVVRCFKDFSPPGDTQIMLELQLLANGTVSEARATPPSDAAMCIQDRAMKWTFSPSNENVTVKIPLSFVKR